MQVDDALKEPKRAPRPGAARTPPCGGTIPADGVLPKFSSTLNAFLALQMVKLLIVSLHFQC